MNSDGRKWQENEEKKMMKRIGEKIEEVNQEE